VRFDTKQTVRHFRIQTVGDVMLIGMVNGFWHSEQWEWHDLFLLKMTVTRSSTRPTAQYHKSLATLLWKLQTSHCRCVPSLWTQLNTSSFRLAEWRTEQQVPLKMDNYLGDAWERLLAVCCFCLRSPQLSTLWWPVGWQQTVCTLFYVKELSHTDSSRKGDWSLSYWQA